MAELTFSVDGSYPRDALSRALLYSVEQPGDRGRIDDASNSYKVKFWSNRGEEHLDGLRKEFLRIMKEEAAPDGT